MGLGTWATSPGRERRAASSTLGAFGIKAVFQPLSGSETVLKGLTQGLEQ